MPGIYNFGSIKRGDTFRGVTLKLWNDAEATQETDCSNARILMQVRRDKFSPAVLEWSTDADTITINNTNELVFDKKSKVLMDLDPFVYKYDVEVTWENGDVETVLEGNFPIVNDISKKW